MSPNRFQLEGLSLDELNSRVLAEYGPHAKVVAVKAVTKGGIQGFFAQRHYELEIDVPDGSPGDAHSFDLPARAGIERLLDGADRDEARAFEHSLPRLLSGPSLMPQLSTSSVDFDEIMADLTYNTAPALAALPAQTRLPVFRQPPLFSPGDLILVIGLTADAIEVAREMATDAGTPVLRTAGACGASGIQQLTDRRGVLAARAEGVRDRQPVFVALGLPRTGLDDTGSAAIDFLGADQVWLAVDAGRKPADTERWVRNVEAALRVDAIAVFGSEGTSTPKTVYELGLQVGWVEGGSVG